MFFSPRNITRVSTLTLRRFAGSKEAPLFSERAESSCLSVAQSHMGIVAMARSVADQFVETQVALQRAPEAPPPKAAGLLPLAPIVTPSPPDLDRLAALLNGDDCITIVCGSGCQGAHDELEQKSTGFLEFSTDFKNPNFAAMAKAVGIRGIRIEDAGKVENAIAAAFAHDGPVLVDAVVNRTALAMPPSTTVEMAKGFTLYMLEAIISGRGDDLIDLAKTNPWR
jgi:Thiamine pyrophosphate enzyme, C-terminal TPP binding domain